MSYLFGGGCSFEEDADGRRAEAQHALEVMREGGDQCTICWQWEVPEARWTCRVCNESFCDARPDECAAKFTCRGCGEDVCDAAPCSTVCGCGRSRMCSACVQDGDELDEIEPHVCRKQAVGAGGRKATAGARIGGAGSGGAGGGGTGGGGAGGGVAALPLRKPRKPRAPMSDDAKRSMAAKRAATIAAKRAALGAAGGAASPAAAPAPRAPAVAAVTTGAKRPREAARAAPGPLPAVPREARAAPGPAVEPREVRVAPGPAFQPREAPGPAFEPRVPPAGGAHGDAAAAPDGASGAGDCPIGGKPTLRWFFGGGRAAGASQRRGEL